MTLIQSESALISFEPFRRSVIDAQDSWSTAELRGARPVKMMGKRRILLMAEVRTNLTMNTFIKCIHWKAWGNAVISVMAEFRICALLNISLLGPHSGWDRRHWTDTSFALHLTQIFWIDPSRLIKWFHDFRSTGQSTRVDPHVYFTFSILDRVLDVVNLSLFRGLKITPSSNVSIT